jgi:creatinine deaminase
MKNQKDLDSVFMEAAIEEARAGSAEGGIPIGAVLVRDGVIISRGRNQRVQQDNAILHAEMHCLMNAGRQKTYRDTVLYSTLAPCYMCSGAAVQFKVGRVVAGEDKNFPGDPSFFEQHGIPYSVMQNEELIALMSKFIQEHPELWFEDIGEIA